MRKLLLAIVFLVGTFSAQAAVVDTVWVESPTMKESYRCVVILPSVKEKEQARFPVTYLLHGYSGWYSNWIIRVPSLQQYADQFRMIIVCPEGKNNWYMDSPVNNSIRWETYVGKEIPTYIDAHYPTIPNRNARAITGLSMGGHGGLYIGLKNAATFGACGSMSGALDLRPFKKSWELNHLLGDSIQHAQNWEDHSVINLIDHYPKDTLAMIIDCGVDDFFFSVNESFHKKLLTQKIPHDYITRPGKHDWKYWTNAIRYQLLFFHRYFNAQKS
jgi:S-formylglutathione hydrolase FrmB